MNDIRTTQLKRVKEIQARTGWSRARLAREANVDASTLTKFVNDPDNLSKLNENTMERIEVAAAQTGLSRLPSASIVQFREPEALLFAGANDIDTREIADLAKELSKRDGIDVWRLKSRALEVRGYMPGDLLVVDSSLQPNDGDAVCAQVYRDGSSVTVFRLLEGAFLVSASYDTQFGRPILADGDHATVMGVVAGCLRGRRAA